MEPTAFYRKYRPVLWKDVIGQDHIVSILEGALKKGSITHAYLFEGSRGTGKTSVARILAREVGCSEKDLYEIDAASNRGIDDIRELREHVHTLPFESPYKVYIVDEVHMLTKEAFNALLKTLEEPPGHALFILATTELAKLPETVISRCEHHTFKRPTQAVLAGMVVSVAKKEGIILERASADLVALLGDGSFRDTLGILQKVLIVSDGKTISAEDVEAVTGAPKGVLLNDTLAALAKSDSAKGLAAVSKAVEGNVDMEVFMKLLLARVRAVLLIRYAPDLVDTLKSQFGEDDFAFLKKLADDKDNAVNSAMLDTLLSAAIETLRAYIPELPLELALIKLSKQEAHDV